MDFWKNVDVIFSKAAKVPVMSQAYQVTGNTVSVILFLYVAIIESLKLISKELSKQEWNFHITLECLNWGNATKAGMGKWDKWLGVIVMQNCIDLT